MALTLIIILYIMHFLADFVLQGDLKYWKQISWWEENYPDPAYKNDWVFALGFHGLIWSCFVHLPYIIFAHISGMIPEARDMVIGVLGLSILLHAFIHLIIDHFKCNVTTKKIGLFTDQILHLLQLYGISLLAHGLMYDFMR